MLISAVEQSDSVINTHIHVLFYILSVMVNQDIEYILCAMQYRILSFSILCIIVCIY